jgi:hypothetical protein
MHKTQKIIKKKWAVENDKTSRRNTLMCLKYYAVLVFPILFRMGVKFGPQHYVNNTDSVWEQGAGENMWNWGGGGGNNVLEEGTQWKASYFVLFADHF